MKNYKLVIEYDGARYDGWQGQTGRNGNYIVDKINNVLTEMEHLPVEVIGAVRTEAGVHAYAQIASVKLDTSKKCYEIEQYLNRYLPRDIAVLKVSEADDRFHAAFNVKSIKYEYKITMGEVPSVFDRKYNFYCFKQLDVEAMKKAALCLIGKHDFKAFSENKRMKKSTVRSIYSIDIYQTGNEISINIHGDDFWPNMVRIIIGTLIETGRGEKKPDMMAEILEAQERENAGETAEAKGLFLSEVLY